MDLLSQSRAPSIASLLRASLGAFGALLIAGCGTAPPIPINYAPSSVLSASGTLQISDFVYEPALPAAPTATAPEKKLEKNSGRKVASKKKVASNQIRNTAMGNIFIDRDVNVFVRDAVFAELRFVGVKTDGARPVLRGHIEEFLIDDLGYSVDWTLRVRYELLGADGSAPIYQSVKNTQRNTAKFANVFGAMNETVKLNAEELIKDPAFLAAIKQ